jgi:hypothetical protein
MAPFPHGNRRINVRIKALFSLAVLGYAGFALAQATPTQTVVVEEKKTETVTVVVKETPKPPAFVFELHGFVSSTMFFQDAQFGTTVAAPGPGQPALNVIKTWTADKPLFGGDIRQTRLNFSVRGPEILGGAIPKAVVEVDFFGGDSAGGYGDVSVFPRIRTAYTELKWANTTLQFGQQNMLTIGLIPQSLSHIAFPATYAAGTVGWRQPGIWGYHTFGADTRFEFAWSVQQSGWANTLNAASDNTRQGVASGLPALELRGKFSMGKLLDLWVSGHWQQVDRNGPGLIENKAAWTTLTTALGTVGLKLDTGMLVLQGSAWWGKNAAPLLGNVIQFPPATYAGDIFGYGAWGQLGLNLSKEFSLWYTYGIDHPSYADIFAARMSVMRNQNSMAMVRYQTGGFAMGVEWLYSRTTWNLANAVSNTQAQILADNVLKGNQISFTANYYF